MAERAFYDTAIFMLSLNARDPDYSACRGLVDVDSGGVVWAIVLSDITRAESTLREYLDQLEMRCAQQGVAWVEVKQDEVKQAMRSKRALKPALEQAGMQAHDIKQAFAAAWAKARIFITRDRDFFDPKDKGRRGKKTRGTRVLDVLSGELDLEVMFPADALQTLRHLGTDG